MTLSFKGNPEPSNSRSKGRVLPKEEPWRLPEGYWPLQSPDPQNPFGPPPKIQTPLTPFRIWDDPPIPAPKLPLWPIPTLPSRPDANPFPDPSQPRLPPIAPPEELPPYDLDPSNFPGQGGDQPGGLLGRLLSLRAEQSQYQPTSDDNDRAPFLSADPNFRQLARIPTTAQSTPLPPPPKASASHIRAQEETDQAQQARDAAAAQLLRGVRSVRRAEAPEPDPIDIAKSAGIGLVNGAVNTAGLLGGALTGFGYFPNHFVENPMRRLMGYPDLPADTPGYVDSITPAVLRRSIEGYTGEFHQPRSRVGRYAETIGEMAPLILGGGIFGGAAELRALPRVLAMHAVLPGLAVQGLEEALPDSGAGQTLQKAYPLARQGLPVALTASRYLGRQTTPK